MRIRCTAVALLVSLTSCKDTLSPPGGFRVVQSTTFERVLISWTPVSDVDGYELEGRVLDDPWQRLHDGLLPSNASGGYLEFPSTTPELLPLGFRIRSVRGSATSAWVETSFQTGIREPLALSVVTGMAWDLYTRTGPISLSWTNRSDVATELRIERAATIGSAPGPFEPLPGVAFGATSYLDDGHGDRATYVYRLSYGKGGVWSQPVQGQSEYIDVVAPRDLAAVRGPGGTSLTWRNLSTVAQMEVYRHDPGTSGSLLLAVLPVGANAYQDPGGSLWPGTPYQVRAVPPLPWVSLFSPPVPIQPFVLEGAVRLQASGWALPAEGAIAATPGGRIHVLGLMPFQQGRILYRDTGTGWDAHPLTGVYDAPPSVRADGAGEPHTVYYRGYPGQPTTVLVHDWWDGIAWRSEDLAAGLHDGAKFGVAPDGTLHVIYGRDGVAGAIHLAGRDGVFTETVLQPALPPLPPDGSWLLWACSLLIGDDGTAAILLDYLAYGYQHAPVLVLRSPSGAWTEEAVPFSDVTTGATLLGAGRQGAAALLQARWDAAVLLRRVGGAWGAEEDAPPLVNRTRHGAAVSPDGTRTLVLADGPLYLLVHEGGAWTEMELGPSSPWHVDVGHDPAGLAFVAAQLGVADNFAAIAWYRELAP